MPLITPLHLSLSTLYLKQPDQQQKRQCPPCRVYAVFCGGGGVKWNETSGHDSLHKARGMSTCGNASCLGVQHWDTRGLSAVRLSQWERLKKAGMAPGPRASFGLAAHKKRAVLFGGITDQKGKVNCSCA